jgi:hypothetical protein
VDDLLAAHGLRLIGAGAVSAAVLHHAGFQLFPLDEDALPPADEAGAECQTAAALVPLGMLPADSSRGSESSSGSEDEAAAAHVPGR